MIDVQALSKSFAGKEVLSDINFQVQDGEILGFLGPNGAGKTTTMRILTGFLAPTKGSVTINQRNIATDSLAIRRRIGYLPENNPLYTDMRVFEALRFVASAKGLHQTNPEIQRVVKVCALTEVIARPIHELSKGFKQRVGLAQALLGNPDILILDEPTSGLDPNQASEVRDLIKRIGAEKTVLFSSHILQEVTATCNRVVILHRGRVVARGTPAELSAQAHGQAAVRAILEGPQHAIRPALQAIAGVSNVRISTTADGETVYTLQVGASASVQPNTNVNRSDTDVRRQVFALAKQNNWILLGMEREQANLETIFRELTTK